MIPVIKPPKYLLMCGGTVLSNHAAMEDAFDEFSLSDVRPLQLVRLRQWIGSDGIRRGKLNVVMYDSGYAA